MASKKEHMRKRKAKEQRPVEQPEAAEAAGAEAERRPFFPGLDLNSLDLLSYPAAKPGETAETEESETEPAAESAIADAASDAADAAAEAARREAEEAAAALRAEEARIAEETRRAAEAEARRLVEEAAEKARREAEEAEAAAAAEKARLEAEAAEVARKAEEARLAAEAEAAALARKAEEARKLAEEEERRRREAVAAAEAAKKAAEEEQRRADEEAARKRSEQEAAERARKMAEEAERTRQMAEAVAAARKEAEETERALRVRAETEREEQARRAEEMAAKAEEFRTAADRLQRDREELLAPPPPLEITTPPWEKPPEIFDVLSGAPHGSAAGTGAAPEYATAAANDAVLPVSMAEPRTDISAPPPGAFADSLTEWRDDTATAEDSYMVPPEKRMYIVMVTPEVAPCAKVGGLGDVILGLGRELMKRGHGVEVICPMYSNMRYDLIDDLHEEYAELWCPHNAEWRAEKVFQGKVGGSLQVNFITGGAYTERPDIYGYDDDLQRFTYFSRQALEFMYKTNRRPDIIHCHDWATGLVPPIYWDIYEKLGWNNSRFVYTIHNNECQGLCGFGDKLLGLVGLDVKDYHRPDRMQDDAHKNCINMMKAGIVYSNFVTTVSPTYAGELKTAAGGRGLQTTLAKHSAKIGGVLNGLDYDVWNPQTDDKLAARYSVGEDFYEKYKNKTELRNRLGMWDAWKPMIGVVTRLTHQKGLDLIKHAIYSTQKMQTQFVLLGSAPDPKVNDDFLRMQYELRDNHDINLYIGYNEDISRLIYAGCDMFLVPSMYEPCGLTQMISLRYGTVPIVRETGGLVDTVFDLDNSGRGLNDANGYTFRDPTPLSLDYGLERAVRLWYDNPEAFNRLARNGMRCDYSWRKPSEHYENIYQYIKA